MNPPKQKFLLIVNDIAWFWSHRLPLAKDILAQGYDLHLATNNAADDPAIKALGITGHDLPAHTGSFNPLGQLALAVKIFTHLKNLKPDMVHAITLRHAFFTGIAARILRLPRAVFTLAGLGPLLSSDHPKIKIIRALVVPLLSCAFGGKGRFVIFQNPDDAAALIGAGAVKKENTVVIRGSGVDVAQFAFSPIPEQEIPVILFSSRLLKAKGIGEFVHAARIIKSKGIPARFVVAGEIAEGNHDSITRDQLKDWITEGAIEWLGHRSDMPAVMAGAQIVTLPSYYGEGVPKVLLEAAAIGRPIVTTDMPGCRETVEDGATGFLIEPKNAWALADALEKLILNPALCAAMGQKGRARIETDFTVEIVNARTCAVYDELLEK
jgi:glycosyltransferase involved in cell wall biosynthesis